MTPEEQDCYDALRAERDEAVRLCAVHKEDAMREITDLQAGWQRTYDHDVARLQERLAAAERPCKTYDKDGKLLTVCHNLATAEHERDEAVALLKDAQYLLGDGPACDDFHIKLRAFLNKLRDKP